MSQVLVAARSTPSFWSVSLNFRAPASLSRADRDALFVIANDAAATGRAWFDDQLDHYDEILVLEAEGRPIGLVGLATFHVGGARVLYTGAVTLDPAWRGLGLIQWAGLRCAARLIGLDAPWWLMDTDSWRAYARTAGALGQVWPARGPAPGFYLAVCAARYGDDFDPARGVCRPLAHRRLRPAVTAIPATALANPHVRDFVARNPGHADGDAVPMLARLDAGNLAHLALACARAALGWPKGAGLAKSVSP